jgi:hypothetical protein
MTRDVHSCDEGVKRDTSLEGNSVAQTLTRGSPLRRRSSRQYLPPASCERMEYQVAAEERYAHGVGTVVEVAQARQATAQAQLLQVQAEGVAEDAYQSMILG